MIYMLKKDKVANKTLEFYKGTGNKKYKVIIKDSKGNKEKTI